MCALGLLYPLLVRRLTFEPSTANRSGADPSLAGKLLGFVLQLLGHKFPKVQQAAGQALSPGALLGSS